MNKFYSMVTVMFFGWCGDALLNHYGGRWEFGPYGLPTTLLAEDGVHYLDGSAVEPLILNIVNAGWETEVQLVLVAIVATTVFALVRICRQMEASRRTLRRLKAFNEAMRQRSAS